MVQKQLRFKSWDGFIQIVLKKGLPARSESFSLRTLPSEHDFIQSRYKKLVNTRPKLNSEMKLAPKFAVVVSKKVSKSAVVRNRIRRRVFEWIRINQSDFKDDQLTMVFVHTDTVAKISYKELDSQLNELFKKAKLYN
ncbi:MAG: ribonuclease P protein component [Candidatus Nomurabacteria bacterium]|nr:MAG: ribonuclease P protein component [Candidatus Nomurabacteria bacterium]HRV76072.1 ribonuclease P protein component [Candidatus Saccharimonadales bacterium]